MSRNSDRLGATRQDTQPPAQMEDSGGFSFVVPTDFVELPSGGRFYSPNHPLHNQESIEIKQMTAKEEDILTSQTLLKKGVALERVIANLIVDKRINPNSLLVGDKNAIIIAIRKYGYGNIYQTKVTCPSCSTSQDYSFDLNEANVYNPGDDLGEDVTLNENGTFSTTLPKTKVNVCFRLLTGTDEKSFLKGMEDDKRSKVEKNITRQLYAIIVSLNGDTSEEAKRYFVENVPSIDSRFLRTAYKLAAPNIDLTQNFVCSQCSHEQDMEVPLSADFFWSNT